VIRTSAVSMMLISAACAGPAPHDTTVQLKPQCQVVAGKADRRCTPGALNPDVTQATIRTTICVKGWTATVRPPVSYTDRLKRQQMVQYGEVGALSTVEEDHFVALGSGGAPTDPRNLWPEPRSTTQGAAAKDTEEIQTQKDICAGRITLAQGQARLIADWGR
jgi:hypothetical protein